MASATVFRNIGTLLTLQGVAQKKGRHVKEADLAIIERAAMVVRGGAVIWLGQQKHLPKEFSKKTKEVDLQGQTVLPGFVECHTHAIFAGTRADEFELRNQGVSYQDIAAKGGGILSTMRHTRQASAMKLKALTQARVNRFIQQGVTTLEIKTGYALDLKNEIKCLQVIRGLAGIRIVPTYLGAHAIPSEFPSAREYLNFILEKVLPEVHQKKLAKRVDIFIEKGFFSKEESLLYLKQVRALGFDIAIHADQLSLSGGSRVAVEVGAKSADHVIQVGDSEIERLARSEVTAVLLPAADLYLGCAYPPARRLIDAGARVALATDFNPGSSPTQDLSVVGLLARLQMKMTLPEVIAAYTYNAACALALQQDVGFLAPGNRADFFSMEKNWDEIFYSIGEVLPAKIFFSGCQLHLT